MLSLLLLLPLGLVRGVLLQCLLLVAVAVEHAPLFGPPTAAGRITGIRPGQSSEQGSKKDYCGGTDQNNH